jgi:hypothetical protein
MRPISRNLFLSAAALAVLASVPLTLMGRNAAEAARREESRIDIGFEVAPVELDLTNKNRRLVGLGSYLVNVEGGCVGCHTTPTWAPGGNPFLGEPPQVNTANYLAGGASFGPNLVSPNITPASNGAPSGHTYSEFLAIMRTGADHHGGGEVMQVMPWPSLGKMTDLELRAMYEYLRAIPHADPAPPADPG